ncbi:MAG: hypothetical protein ACR2PG_13095 [Hyphomicrobiaceae bacterium]
MNHHLREGYDPIILVASRNEQSRDFALNVFELRRAATVDDYLHFEHAGITAGA